MAAAAIADPHELLVSQALSALGCGNEFVTSNKLSAPATVASANSTALATEATDDRFPLSNQSFLDLQKYLLAAIKLPHSREEFEQVYNRTLLEPYTKKDSDTLYDFMRDTLVNINTHCTEFRSKTMNSMIITASKIANFGNVADDAAGKISAALDKICVPGANSSNSEVDNAYTSFSEAIDLLRVSAQTAMDDCERRHEELGMFQTITLGDQKRLADVNTRTDRVLPTTADLDSDMRKKMQAAYEKINGIVTLQNQRVRRQRIINAVGVIFIPTLGAPLIIGSWIYNRIETNNINEASTEFDKAFAEQDGALRHGITLRSVTNNLRDAIDETLEAIEKASNALQNMIGAFSRLTSDLTDIDGNLGLAYGQANATASFRRRNAPASFKKASDTWKKVRALARDFEEKGLTMEREMGAHDPIKIEIPLEVVGSSYGGVDVTHFSQVLFNSGADKLIRSVEPGFRDPWDGISKSITALIRYGNSTRIFVCAENTGSHYIKPGDVSQSNITNAVYREVDPFAKPANCIAKILAICWGPAEVRDKSVYDYVYSCWNNEPVKFSNATMGGDTWAWNRKSATIYYSFEDGGQVYQCGGKEGEEAHFR